MTRIPLIAAVLLLGWTTAAAEPSDHQKMMLALEHMMVALAPESARDSQFIKEGYRPHLDYLVLDEYSSVEAALHNGGLAPLPVDPLRFNLTPRVHGASPIGEKDLLNQMSYLSARPATIGALLTVAARVNSGPIEITSLVRHSEYQGELRKTNTNATTSVPMHTMGLAFDIALLNTPLSRAYEIRDVLREMRDAGDILFIGERQQLVFHVVPHPSRLGYFTDVYTKAVTAPVPSVALPVVNLPPLTAEPEPVVGEVTTEIIDLLPVEEFAAEWWAADAQHGDLVLGVTPTGVTEGVRPPLPRRSSGVPLAAYLMTLVATVSAFVRRSSRDQKNSLKSLLRS